MKPGGAAGRGDSGSIGGATGGAGVVIRVLQGGQGDPDATADAFGCIDDRDGAVVQSHNPTRDGQTEAGATVRSPRRAPRGVREEPLEHPVALAGRNPGAPVR